MFQANIFYIVRKFILHPNIYKAKVDAEWVEFLCIQEVSGSNVGQDAAYLDTIFIRHVLQETYNWIPQKYSTLLLD
jgi:hypothetical protein